MTSKQVGKFTVGVAAGGYPVWVSLTHDKSTLSFRHSELRDLEYAVQSAIVEANSQLARMGDEKA